MDGLALGINNITRRRCDLSHHHALAGFEPLDTNFTILVRAENAVRVANDSSVCIHNFELCIRKCDAGVDRAHLSYKQDAVRHILKAHSDYTLLTAICQVDGFRRLNDAVAVRRVHFFQNIGASLEACPDGSPVFAGHFLANHGTTCARGSAEVSQLEGTPRQHLAGDTVILFYNNGVERYVFKLYCLLLSAVDNNLLDCGFLHLESRSRRNLFNRKFAGVQTLPLFMQANFAVGIGRDFSKVKRFRCIRSFPGAGVGHVEMRTLDGGATDTVHLIDCQFRGFVVLEHHFL